jgi:hypothetical protein
MVLVHEKAGLDKRFGPAGLTWNDGSTQRIRGEGSATEVQSWERALTRRFRALNAAPKSLFSHRLRMVLIDHLTVGSSAGG